MSERDRGFGEHKENLGRPSLVILSNKQYLASPDIYQQVEGEDGFLRRQWPKIYEDPDLGDWVDPNSNSTRVILKNGNEVVAHAGILERFLPEPEINIAILGGVLVKEEERSKGYGSILVQKATELIREKATEDNLAAATLTCRTELIPFYSRFGWEKDPNSENIRYGVTEETSHVAPDMEVTMSIHLKENVSLPPYIGKQY